MFGIFRRRPDRHDRLQAVMELGAEFTRLQQDAPGAAWFFARSLLNMRASKEFDGMSLHDKIANVEVALRPEYGSSPTARSDGGMFIFAMRALLASLKAERRGENLLVHEMTVHRIASEGATYRQLTEADSRPPRDRGALKILQESGFQTLSQLIASIEQQGSETLQTTVALFDIREEASSGRLRPHIERLTDIISRM
jgi:hypothetical protein